jgi:hypothetical protein
MAMLVWVIIVLMIVGFLKTIAKNRAETPPHERYQAAPPQKHDQPLRQTVEAQKRLHEAYEAAQNQRAARTKVIGQSLNVGAGHASARTEAQTPREETPGVKAGYAAVRTEAQTPRREETPGVRAGLAPTFPEAQTPREQEMIDSTQEMRAKVVADYYAMYSTDNTTPDTTITNH